MRTEAHREQVGWIVHTVLLAAILVVVTGIFVLLAEARVRGLAGNRGHGARIDICRAEIGWNGPIAKALKSYKWDMGKFPDTDEGLAALFQSKKEVDDERYKGPYLEGALEELKDPWGNAYEYRSPGEFNEEEYDLWSWGPNMEDDGEKEDSDDVKNWIEK
ncbi:MAG: type II secretion system protein GspG [Phycisphaerales bacterium]|nr:MAG: type II secretion system protein GspG [Phycisphaerales bacterium]